jgi:large conductance mechanosensitive channel|tara:strand:+ start:7 stop:471 length:465 start_codon:yes stop_codon:yes gene_type:complete
MIRANAYALQEPERIMGFLSEFKAFAVRGNVIDLAVGLVIGTAFGKIVSSLVADIISPPLGLLIGGVDFSGLSVTLRQAVGDTPAVTLNYGVFIQTVISFVIVAFAIFLVVRAINSLKRKEAEAPSAPPAPSVQETLLTEIRDALRERNAQDRP